LSYTVSMRVYHRRGGKRIPCALKEIS